MTRSQSTTGRHRPIVVPYPHHNRRPLLRRLPLASAISAILVGGAPLAQAQTVPSADILAEVTVTA
jgi:hypothetical protein